MEILAPAGSPESLIAAISGGADAVYLAGKSFGARSFAKNFDDYELEGAVSFAHSKGVKVNVTVNTLVKNRELEEAVSFVQFVKDIGADAVIIQDLGLLRAIENIPIAKHASTQMQIHSLEGVEWCAENGISRAILARELTFDEISDIVKASPIETEVFVQGAMCYSMSGGCLFSSIVGGRSGNRGECAQPCRKKYFCDEGEGYLMSNADLFAIDYLKKLEEIGVSSVKIEGRMRSPAYAYLATKAYSLMLNDSENEELSTTLALLKTVFNRGYCTGYFDGVKNIVQSTYPDNRGQLIGTVTIKNRKFDTHGLGLGIKDGVSFFYDDVKAGGYSIVNPEGIETVPFPIKDGNYQLYRTYDPRIDVVKNLIGRPPKFTGKVKRCEKHIPLTNVSKDNVEPAISFYVSSLKTAEAVEPYADRIYFDGPGYMDAFNKFGDKVIYCLPRFTSKEPDIDENIGVMVHNPGQMKKYSETHDVYCSSVCNMFNSLFPSSSKCVTLSQELTKQEIKDIGSTFSGQLECMMFGRQELMYTRSSNLPEGSIKDEKGYVFPVYRDSDGFTRILNSSDLMLYQYKREIERYGIESFGIDVRKRPTALAKELGILFKENNQDSLQKIRRMCGGTFNTGHYLRGV